MAFRLFSFTFFKDGTFSFSKKHFQLEKNLDVLESWPSGDFIESE